MSRQTPGLRPHAWYGDKDLDFDLMLSRQFWGLDAHYTGTIFRLDGVRSIIDEVYGEILSEEKIFFPPVEVTLIPNIDEITNTYQVPGGLRKQQYQLFVGFYLDELEKKKCRPHDGDFLLYDDGQGPQFYELANVDELLGNNTRAAVPFYVGAVGNMKNGDAIPDGLKNWK